jgi:hypothetical protein
MRMSDVQKESGDFGEKKRAELSYGRLWRAGPERSKVNILFCGGKPTVWLYFLELLPYARQIGFKRLYVTIQRDLIRAGAGLCSEVKAGAVT